MPVLVRTDRDLRVDFCRGLALWMIFVDHIPGNWAASFTLRNFALCDATEAFVLLSGYGAGIAYGRMLQTQGYVPAAAQALQRAWTLYIAHIFLFVVFTAQVGYSAAALDNAAYIEEIHLDRMASEPYRALLEALLLRYQPAFLNILPMYIAALAGFALVMPLLRRPGWLLGLSLAVWLAARLVPFNLPSWTGGGWFFNPFAWQLLFMLGAVLATTPLPRLRAPRVVDALAVVLLIAGAAILTAVWHRPELGYYLPSPVARVVLSIDKSALHPLRLISILAIAWLVARAVPAGAAWMRSRPALPVLLMGQQGLPVFCAGIFLSFIGRLAMEVDDGVAVQVVVNLTGLAVLVAVAALAAWYRDRGRGGGRSRGAVAATIAAAFAFLVIAPGAGASSPCDAPAELVPDITPLPHARQAARGDKRLRVLAIGAASTAAPGIGPADRAYPYRMAEALGRLLPGTEISLRVRGTRGLTAAEMVTLVRGELSLAPADLVIWQTGTVEAVRGADLPDFAATLEEGIAAVNGREADLILVTPQFSRFLRTNANIDPYLEAMQAAAALPEVALFPRYDLMRFWADAGRIDLERTRRADRDRMTDLLYACIGERLAAFIRAGIDRQP